MATLSRFLECSGKAYSPGGTCPTNPLSDAFAPTHCRQREASAVFEPEELPAVAGVGAAVHTVRSRCIDSSRLRAQGSHKVELMTADRKDHGTYRRTVQLLPRKKANAHIATPQGASRRPAEWFYDIVPDV